MPAITCQVFLDKEKDPRLRWGGARYLVLLSKYDSFDDRDAGFLKKLREVSYRKLQCEKYLVCSNATPCLLINGFVNFGVGDVHMLANSTDRRKEDGQTDQEKPNKGKVCCANEKYEGELENNGNGEYGNSPDER